MAEALPFRVLACLLILFLIFLNFFSISAVVSPLRTCAWSLFRCLINCRSSVVILEREATVKGREKHSCNSPGLFTRRGLEQIAGCIIDEFRFLPDLFLVLVIREIACRFRFRSFAIGIDRRVFVLTLDLSIFRFGCQRGREEGILVVVSEQVSEEQRGGGIVIQP